MSIYDEMRAVTSEVMAEFKQGEVRYGVMTVPAGASPDRTGTPVPSYTPINSAVIPVRTKYVDGTNIVQSDKQVTMPNDGIEPDMKGWVEIDGLSHKIIEILRHPAAGVAVSFTLIVRR